MAEALPFKPVKYFCGLISARDFDLSQGEQCLTERLGAVDLRFEPVPFEATDYYLEQMGPDLLRSFIAFEPLRDPAELPDIKLFANALEIELSSDYTYPRIINIDPGYLDGPRMVLASAKQLAHRLPLRDGIYGQLEYLFRSGGKVEFLDWSFPEYCSEEITRFFIAVRARYLEQVKSQGLSQQA